MQVDKQINAWVTYICNDDFLDGVVCLKKSLDRVKTQFDLYCMITREVSSSSIDTLREINVETILVDRIEVGRTKGIKDRYKENSWMMFTKMNIWRLVQFNSLVYLDADLVFVQNADELITQTALNPNVFFAAAEHIAGDEGIQAGLMFVRPDIEVFDDMLKKVEFEDYDNTHSDQSFVNWYFQKNNIWAKLPDQYNVLQKRAPLAQNFNNIKVYHYNGQKPWIPHDENNKASWRMGETFEYIFWKYIFDKKESDWI